LTRIAIVGFGSQAKAWALNLKDSEKNVHIALRPGSTSHQEVAALGLKSIELGSKLREFSVFILLTPDHTHKEILDTYQEFIHEGSKIIYAHGYSYIKHNLKNKFKTWDHLLLAPKAIASEVRFQFETGGKLGAIMSLEGSNDPKDRELLQDIAKGIGITAGPYENSFKDETYADLFSEQSILCSLLPYGALHSYNKLRERGIGKEMAYMECWYEVKLIADTMIKLGPLKFFELISPNALIGGEKARKLIFNEEYNKVANKLLDDIWENKFFQEVDNQNFDALKNEVMSFWKNEELNTVHEDLKENLF
jgi:ketol-acid reductoisomerase